MTSPIDNIETIHDNPTGWVSSHIAEYVETEGQKGHRWRGVDTLLVITKGRKTGKLRRTALIYGIDGSNYVVVGSRGGHRNHPAWYLNLVADPHVRIQVGSDHFDAVARTAADGERARLWEKMSAIWPPYDDYQKKTDREIPIVVIEPA
jgi:deazaflavin-dependent oxidoreductase (nitroreductase family)